MGLKIDGVNENAFMARLGVEAAFLFLESVKEPACNGDDGNGTA